MKSKHYLTNIYCGKVAQRYGMETAIDKQVVEGPVYLSLEGLAGDECGDKIHHGGVERALHQYPAEHYAYWQKKYQKAFDENNVEQVNWQAAGMGENLSSLSMTEETVCLGDRYQWGEAIIEVSQPRSPCFQLNKRWGIENLSVDMQEVSRCGWLYRVIQPGMVSVDEPLQLINRVTNAMTIKAVCDAFFNDPLNKEGLLQLQNQSTLSDTWMDRVLHRIETNEVESWNFRLFGHV
ncbi:MOSC domain-containing protein [Colwellia psychrerythraea]|uniref:MOSC domain containing protein n=1 Tax=Colwellia psychrerythraea TaxID=28229 RepID=A0A099KMU9_COLPS|nr:MOSC domain-containing protein [Colwellia psychrerythraea]KGJ90978.1 MOSC domain containing protein [Colwellia psychrerythraea]